MGSLNKQPNFSILLNKLSMFGLDIHGIEDTRELEQKNRSPIFPPIHPPPSTCTSSTVHIPPTSPRSGVWWETPRVTFYCIQNDQPKHQDSEASYVSGPTHPTLITPEIT